MNRLIHILILTLLSSSAVLAQQHNRGLYLAFDGDMGFVTQSRESSKRKDGLLNNGNHAAHLNFSAGYYIPALPMSVSLGYSINTYANPKALNYGALTTELRVHPLIHQPDIYCGLKLGLPLETGNNSQGVKAGFHSSLVFGYLQRDAFWGFLRTNIGAGIGYSSYGYDYRPFSYTEQAPVERRLGSRLSLFVRIGIQLRPRN